MTLDTGFQTDQPAVGPAIFENLTDDLKVTWSLTWIFTLARSAHFSSGYAALTISTVAELVPDEYQSGRQWPAAAGASLHADAGANQYRRRGGDLDGNVIANHLYNADDEFDDIIVELPPPWDSWLDIVVTGYPDGRDRNLSEGAVMPTFRV
jgi:hypothetical protein